MSRKLRGASVQLYDLNGFPNGNVTLVQARRLVLDGQAVPSTDSGAGELPGWQGRRWADWPTIRMVRPSQTAQSPCCLTQGDSHLVAGEQGKTIAARRAEERLHHWPITHDQHAVTIIAGRGAFIPSPAAIRARAMMQTKLHAQARKIEQSQASKAWQASQA